MKQAFTINRKFLAVAHKYMGLILAAFALLQAGTGVALLFKRDILEALGAVNASNSRISLNDIITSVPSESYLRQIDYTADGASPHILHIVDERGVVLHQVSQGRVAQAEISESVAARFYDIIFHVHHDLLLGDFGRWILAVLAFWLFISIILGIVLWWPGRARVRQSLKINRGAPTILRWYQIHKVVGVAVFLPLSVTLMAGFGLALAPDLRASFVEPLPSVAVEHGSEQRNMDPDALLRIASSTFPNSKLRDVRFTKDQNLPYRFLFHRPEEESDGPPLQVILDPISGDAIWRSDRVDASVSGIVLDWLYPIHTRFALGWGGKWLTALTGLMLLALMLTGLLRWSARNAKRPISRA